jgi:hypothetical protein
MNKASFIPNSDNVDSIITGGGGDRWANFSFKDLTLESVLNQATVGVYGNIKMATTGTGDFGDQLKNTFSGGIDWSAKDTGVAKEARSAKQKATDNWNAKDPYKLFPVPENPTCENMRELRDKLVLEQAGAQYSYNTKVIKYIQEIDDALAKNDCEKQLLDQESYDQAERSINVAKMGLGVNTQGSVSSMTPMSIALIAGSVLFVGVVAIILVRSSGSKSS